MPGSQRDKAAATPTPNPDGKRNRERGSGGNKRKNKKCKKQKYRDYFIEEHGCRSKKPYKMAKCLSDGNDECVATKVKTRKIKFVCPDGSSPRKDVEIVRKCGRRKKTAAAPVNNWG